MSSVTGRIKQVKQPRGGYVRVKDFEICELKDELKLNEAENIHASTVGLVVDYMTRYMNGASLKRAFGVSLLGSKIINEYEYAVELLENIEGLDDKSLKSACKLVGFDVCFRAGLMGYKPVEEINPDKETLDNIRVLINRSLLFFKKYGPVTLDGFTFEGAYTDLITTGDGDFLTQDTLWDFKVSKTKPKTQYTLQLLIYYLMGMKSVHPEFNNITKLGVYNPRLNTVYTIRISSIDETIINEVSRDVIGY